MIKKLISKLPIFGKSKLQEIIDRAVDNALTQYRRNEGFDNSYIPMDSGGDISYMYENKPRLIINPKDFGLSKVSESVSSTVADSFVSSPAAIREQSREDLILTQEAAAAKYITDPHAASIVNNIRYYTIGSGVYVKAPDPAVQTLISDFNMMNKMDQRSKKMVQMGYLMGEYFLALFFDPKTGYCFVRRVNPDEITDIEADREDIETPIVYHREAILSDNSRLDKWYTDIELDWKIETGQTKGISAHSGNAQKNTFLQFIRYGLEDEERGRVPMYSVLKFLKYYEDFLVDRIRLNHERSKVVWIKSITGRSPEALTKDRKAPRGGTMLVENENVKYRIESAKLESADAERDGLLVLYHVGAGVGLPLHILDQRADQQVYASIRKADTPFSQMIMDHQDFWYNHFEVLYRKVIDLNVKAKKLPPTVKVEKYMIEAQIATARFINTAVAEGMDPKLIIEQAKKMMDAGKEMVTIPTTQVPLDIIFPDVVTENLLEQAQVLQIHSQIGIASRATLSSKAGYNWQMELKNLVGEMEVFMPPEGDSGTPKNDRKLPASPKTNKN